LACPFFLPTEKFDGTWIHPLRLPLGCGWSGRCTAPEHDGETPSLDEQREFCNLGYAESCPRLPRERTWDSVRFGVRAKRGEAAQPALTIYIQYVCERAHRPVEHGILEFDAAQQKWMVSHPHRAVQRMAECFVAARTNKPAIEERP